MNAIPQRLEPVEDQTQKLLASVADRVLNPVTGIRAALQILEREVAATQIGGHENIVESISRIKKSLATLNLFVEDLQSYSTDQQGARTTESVRYVLDDAVRRVRESTLIQLILKTNIDPSLNVHVDRQAVTRVISMLLLNAIESVPIDKEPEVSVSAIPSIDTFVKISIEDNGIGIRAESQREIFRPFYSTKEARAGIGLAIAHKVILGHGGTIALVPSVHGGTCAEITLPTKQQKRDPVR